MKEEFTISFQVFKGPNETTYFVEKYQIVSTGEQFYRYGYGCTDNWTTVQEGLTSKPNLKHLHLK